MDGSKSLRKAEVLTLGSLTPPVNVSRVESDTEYRFRFPDGHPLSGTSRQTEGDGSDASSEGGALHDESNIRDTPDANQVLLDRIAKLESALNRVGSTVELLEREGSGAALGQSP